MLYETAAPAEELLSLNIEDLDLEFRRGGVTPSAARSSTSTGPSGPPGSFPGCCAAVPPGRCSSPTGALQLGTVGVESLAGDLESEFVESAEGGQISAGEARADGGVGHVEVFRMGGVGTSILGRPRPLSGSRRAEPRPPGSGSHSVHPKCEEPDR